ncbi:MAG TPA: hypothetical protein VGC09_08620 [Rhodopila sp.]
MRQTLLTAAAAFVIGGIAMGAVLSRAQPAPPPAEQVENPPPQPGHHWMGGWGHHGGEAGRWMHHGKGLRTFALIYRQEDRQLAPADVQKIAEAFLLWNGNHSWKVTNVAATPDGPIGFSLTTPEGSVVAKFTMDPHTGRVARAG